MTTVFNIDEYELLVRFEHITDGWDLEVNFGSSLGQWDVIECTPPLDPNHVNYVYTRVEDMLKDEIAYIEARFLDER